VILADGRVLIVGGVTSPESAPIELASTEVYDPKAGRWSSAGSLAENRSGFALVALADGGALVVGGFGGVGFTRLSTVERFDPATNSWSAAGALPSPVVGGSAVLLADGRVLLAGGSVREPKPPTGGCVRGAPGGRVSGPCRWLCVRGRDQLDSGLSGGRSAGVPVRPGILIGSVRSG
jgi:hypothetical protein